LRGIQGVPTIEELNTQKWMDQGPLELSPERGRFALLYSFVENKSLTFNLPVAQFATPDLAISNGKYVSLFAPLVSFAMIPGYIIGKSLGASQVGAFAAIGLFGVFNVILIRLIAIRLGAKPTAATLAGLLFIFATPAFTYAVSLYQHHISTFLILLGLYLVIRFKNWFSLAIVWLLFATSIPIDYPNAILMLPIALYATSQILWVEKTQHSLKFNVKILYIFTPILALIPLLFYVWFSTASYGKPLQFSGTLQSVKAIDSQGKPYDPLLKKEENKDQNEKTVKSFFTTRNMLDGVYIHSFSLDRGTAIYTPIVLFGLVGGFILWRSKSTELTIIASIIGTNLVLYSMWGDPWGGYAFGSRYLIPAYSLLMLLTAFALSKFSKNVIFIVIFFFVALYSVGVNTLGALTSSANPPKVEILSLEKQTGKVQKFTYVRNIEFLKQRGSKSFVYNTFLEKRITPIGFYWWLVYIISAIIGLLIVKLSFTKNNDKS
jgi:hypothetical protein